MERRGAAEVVAIDVLDPAKWDWPLASDRDAREAIAERKGAGEGFEIARDAIESSVRRIEQSVYDLDPDDIGRFDLIYLGSLLLHLRDPVLALERVRAVCDGRLLVMDAIDLELSLRTRRPAARLDGKGRPWWWKPNSAGLKRMVESAGFRVVEGPRRVFIPVGPAQRISPRLRLLLSPDGREQLVTALRGDPHAALAAIPL
jgi:tRNA (mo5U34)-methyltransferase